MKKIFETPMIEVLTIEECDILTLSNGGADGVALGEDPINVGNIYKPN